jgi:hypothetical protein
MSNQLSSIHSFKDELKTMLASASGGDMAMQAFSRAITPYLENPEQLRTLLGKIAAGDVAAGTQRMIQEGSFSSLAELNAALPAHVTARRPMQMTA